MPEHIQHRRRGVAVQDGRHRAHAAQTGGREAAQDQPVVGTVAVVAGPRQAQAEDLGRGDETPAARRAGPERRRAAGRALVVPVAVAHEERVEAPGRHIQHAQTQETVQLTRTRDRLRLRIITYPLIVLIRVFYFLRGF